MIRPLKEKDIDTVCSILIQLKKRNIEAVHDIGGEDNRTHFINRV